MWLASDRRWYHILETKVRDLVLDKCIWDQSHHLAFPTCAWLKVWKWKGRTPGLICIEQWIQGYRQMGQNTRLNRKQERKSVVFCSRSNALTTLHCQKWNTVIRQPVAHGLEGSGCHFENILDFTVRSPQAAHNNDSDSVASDVTGDLDIGKQALAYWLCTQNFPLRLSHCLSPKGQHKSRYNGLMGATFKSVEEPFKNTNYVYTSLWATSWEVGTNLKRKI